MSTFEPIKKSGLAEEISTKLISLIKGKLLQPGDKLPPERELAAMLNVSRPSLREALRALAILNIIEIRQGDGTYVSSLDTELLVEHLDLVFSLDDSTILQLFEVRKIFEPEIAALAAARITADQIEAMEATIQAANDVDNDPALFIQFDFKLHEQIAEAAGNPLLKRIMASLSQLGRASRTRTGMIPGVPARSSADHRAIVSSISAQDPVCARTAMLAHLENVEQSLGKVVQTEEQVNNETREASVP